MSAPSATSNDAPSASTAATTTTLSANQLKKQQRRAHPSAAHSPALNASGERLYPARKSKAPPQKQRKEIIAEKNPQSINLRRWGHTCNTLVDDHGAHFLIAFGGWGADTYSHNNGSRSIDHRLNSVAIFHPEQKKFWQIQPCTGVIPSQREQHTSVVIPATASSSDDATSTAASSSFSSLTCRSPHLLIFGGRSNPAHAISSISLLNLSTFEWLTLPPPVYADGLTEEDVRRYRHTAVWTKHKMIVYGGCRYESHASASTASTSSSSSSTAASSSSTIDLTTPCTTHTVHNDILILDTSVSPMRWSRVTPQGCEPAKSISLSSGDSSEIATTATASSSSPLITLPHKHTHSSVYCPLTDSLYIHGGWSHDNFNRNLSDNALYCLDMRDATTPDQWKWSCVSSSFHSSSIPPPPLASSTLHVLSSRYLLLLGGVSSSDMYSLCSLWIVDRKEGRWMRPSVKEGKFTRFHPVLERELALQENAKRYQKEVGDELIINSGTASSSSSAATSSLTTSSHPVRIIEHTFLCKHAAVFVDWQKFVPSDSAASTEETKEVKSDSSSPSSPPSSTHHLLLAGGGGNVFHFNPFFNPTLLFTIEIRDSSVDGVTDHEHGIVTSLVEVTVTDVKSLLLKE